MAKAGETVVSSFTFNPMELLSTTASANDGAFAYQRLTLASFQALGVNDLYRDWQDAAPGSEISDDNKQLYLEGFLQQLEYNYFSGNAQNTDKTSLIKKQEFRTKLRAAQTTQEIIELFALDHQLQEIAQIKVLRIILNSNPTFITLAESERSTTILAAMNQGSTPQLTLHNTKSLIKTALEKDLTINPAQDLTLEQLLKLCPNIDKLSVNILQLHQELTTPQVPLTYDNNRFATVFNELHKFYLTQSIADIDRMLPRMTFVDQRTDPQESETITAIIQQIYKDAPSQPNQYLYICRQFQEQLGLKKDDVDFWLDCIQQSCLENLSCLTMIDRTQLGLHDLNNPKTPTYQRPKIIFTIGGDGFTALQAPVKIVHKDTSEIDVVAAKSDLLIKLTPRVIKDPSARQIANCEKAIRILVDNVQYTEVITNLFKDRYNFAIDTLNETTLRALISKRRIGPQTDKIESFLQDLTTNLQLQTKIDPLPNEVNPSMIYQTLSQERNISVVGSYQDRVAGITINYKALTPGGMIPIPDSLMGGVISQTTVPDKTINCAVVKCDLFTMNGSDQFSSAIATVQLNSTVDAIRRPQERPLLSELQNLLTTPANKETLLEQYYTQLKSTTQYQTVLTEIPSLLFDGYTYKLMSTATSDLGQNQIGFFLSETGKLKYKINNPVSEAEIVPGGDGHISQAIHNQIVDQLNPVNEQFAFTEDMQQALRNSTAITSIDGYRLPKVLPAVYNKDDEVTKACLDRLLTHRNIESRQLAASIQLLGSGKDITPESLQSVSNAMLKPFFESFTTESFPNINFTKGDQELTTENIIAAYRAQLIKKPGNNLLALETTFKQLLGWSAADTHLFIDTISQQNLENLCCMQAIPGVVENEQLRSSLASTTIHTGENGGLGSITIEGHTQDPRGRHPVGKDTVTIKVTQTGEPDEQYMPGSNGARITAIDREYQALDQAGYVKLHKQLVKGNEAVQLTQPKILERIRDVVDDINMALGDFRNYMVNSIKNIGRAIVKAFTPTPKAAGAVVAPIANPLMEPNAAPQLNEAVVKEAPPLIIDLATNLDSYTTQLPNNTTITMTKNPDNQFELQISGKLNTTVDLEIRDGNRTDTLHFYGDNRVQINSTHNGEIFNASKIAFIENREKTPLQAKSSWAGQIKDIKAGQAVDALLLDGSLKQTIALIQTPPLRGASPPRRMSAPAVVQKG
jgi:hypothetical protein